MQVQLRPAAYRFHPLVRPMSRPRGFGGLGVTMSPWLYEAPPGLVTYDKTPYVTATDPQTGQSVTTGGAVIYPTSGNPPIPPIGVYQAPTHVPVPDCVQDTRPGGAAFSAECQAALAAAQQANMAADSAANRAVFVADCENAWAQNAAQYRALGMEVPPDDCQYRGYGLTQPGTTGSFTGYLPGTPQAIIDWRNANPGGGSPGPAAGAAPVGGGAPVFTFTNLTSGNNSSFLVGDRWEVRITGAEPGRGVSVTGGKDGALDNTQMGLVGPDGTYTRNGQMTQAEVGNWVEAWRVNNQIIASFTFKVSPAAAAPTVPTTSSTGSGQTTPTTPSSKSVGGTLPGGSVSIGGMDVPVWALGLGAVALFFVLSRAGK